MSYDSMWTNVLKLLRRWHPPARCMGGGLNTGTMAAVHLALTLQPHNSVSFCMSLVPPQRCPSAEAQGCLLLKHIHHVVKKPKPCGESPCRYSTEVPGDIQNQRKSELPETWLLKNHDKNLARAQLIVSMLDPRKTKINIKTNVAGSQTMQKTRRDNLGGSLSHDAVQRKSKKHHRIVIISVQ